MQYFVVADFRFADLPHENLRIHDLRILREVCLPTSARHGGERTNLPRFVRYSRKSKNIEDTRRSTFLSYSTSHVIFKAFPTM